MTEHGGLKGLLVVAHGSRREPSNEEVRSLAGRIGDLAGPEVVSVRSAFLELARPSIPEGIEWCIRDGAQEVVVLPYFLSAGRHVMEDIPEVVRLKQHECPGVHIRIAPYIGQSPDLAGILLALAQAG